MEVIRLERLLGLHGTPRPCCMQFEKVVDIPGADGSQLHDLVAKITCQQVVEIVLKGSAPI